MNISLHIERLVLDGFDFSPAQRRHLQASLTAELSALIETSGLRSEFTSGTAVPAVPVDAVNIVQGGDAAKFGRQIAQSVFSGIGGNTVKAQPSGSGPKRK
jgi:hypothetical protein